MPTKEPTVNRESLKVDQRVGGRAWMAQKLFRMAKDAAWVAKTFVVHDDQLPDEEARRLINLFAEASGKIEECIKIMDDVYLAKVR